MKENGNLEKVQGILWIAFGVLLVLFFFLPLYGGALYDMNGIDTIDFVREMPNDKIKRFDKLTGILMVGVPAIAVLLGFLAMVFGIAGLGKGKNLRGLGLTVMVVLNLVLGILCIVKLNSQATGFFGAFLPRPLTGFYILMFLHLCLGAIGPLFSFLKK